MHAVPKQKAGFYGSPRQATSKLEIDKDELKRRTFAQEMKRRQEIEELKRRAIEKEQARKLKVASATCIQRWVRGHLVRQRVKRQQVNFKSMRKLRRMISVALGKRRKQTLYRLKTAMKEAGKFVADQRMAIFEKYLTHCATMIQKHWRGWVARNVLLPRQKIAVKRRRAEQQRKLLR